MADPRLDGVDLSKTVINLSHLSPDDALEVALGVLPVDLGIDQVVTVKEDD